VNCAAPRKQKQAARSKTHKCDYHLTCARTHRHRLTCALAACASMYFPLASPMQNTLGMTLPSLSSTCVHVVLCVCEWMYVCVSTHVLVWYLGVHVISIYLLVHMIVKQLCSSHAAIRYSALSNYSKLGCVCEVVTHSARAGSGTLLS